MIDDKDIETFLEHFGVKGMQWGVRKDRPHGVSAHVNRHAKKDAKEFARAKSFYGEGAGTRRKLIKQTVEAKSARLPGYKTAFDHHLGKQDMSKHATKAISERKRTDRVTKNKQRLGFLARNATGEMGTQAAFAAVAVGGAAYLRSPRGKATMNKAVRGIKNAKNSHVQQKGAAKINDFLKKTM